MEKIIYKPFRTYWIVGILMCIFSTFLLVCAGVTLYICWYYALFLLLVTAVCFTFGIHLFRAAKVTVVLDDTGLQLNHPKTSNKYIPWNNFKVFRLDNNLRGHDFVVLSPIRLTPNASRTLVNHSSFSTKLYYDGIVVIPMDPIQNTDAIIKFARQKVEFGAHPSETK